MWLVMASGQDGLLGNEGQTTRGTLRSLRAREKTYYMCGLEQSEIRRDLLDVSLLFYNFNATLQRFDSHA